MHWLGRSCRKPCAINLFFFSLYLPFFFLPSHRSTWCRTCATASTWLPCTSGPGSPGWTCTRTTSSRTSWPASRPTWPGSRTRWCRRTGRRCCTTRWPTARPSKARRPPADCGPASGPSSSRCGTRWRRGARRGRRAGPERRPTRRSITEPLFFNLFFFF